MTPEKLSTEELVDRLDDSQASPEVRAVELRRIIAGVTNGEIAVVGRDYGPLMPISVCKILMQRLDANLRQELIDWAGAFVERELARDRDVYAPDADQFYNVVQIASQLLTTRPVFARLIRVCQTTLSEGQASREALTTCARLLVEARMFGEAPAFWLSIVTREPDRFDGPVPLAFSALFQRWPTPALEQLFRSAHSIRNSEHSARLADYIVSAGDSITAGVTVDTFGRLLRSTSDGLTRDVRDALERIAARRGWAIGGIETSSKAELPVGRDELARAAGSNVAVAQVSGWPGLFQLTSALDGRRKASTLAAFLASEDAGPFPEAQLSNFGGWRHSGGQSPEAAEIVGETELSFVQDSVSLAIQNAQEQRTGDVADVLLEAIEPHGPSISDAAQDAAEALSKLGFLHRPFVLGASEFHEDRLLMNVVAVALRQNGLPGATVSPRAWEATNFRLVGRTAEANIVTTASVVTSASREGIFEFKGFRVFLRLDILEQLVAFREDVPDAVRAVVSAARGSQDLKRALSARDRASVVLWLGEPHAQGAAFDQLLGAIARVAGVTLKTRPKSAPISNDAAFRSFITGKTAIYCGGALNARLIETWWAAAAPENYLELLDHGEIAEGLRTRTAVKSQQSHGEYVENKLKFNLTPRERTPLRENRKLISSAEAALVALFRAAGLALRGWSEEVVRKPYLNGSTRSCEAARKLLEPTRGRYAAQFAFVTTSKDPAHLIMSADRYYVMNQHQIH